MYRVINTLNQEVKILTTNNAPNGATGDEISCPNTQDRETGSSQALPGLKLGVRVPLLPQLLKRY